jgi:hypothetical protein
MMNIKFISKVVKVIFAAYAAALGMTIITMVIGFMVFGGDLISPFRKKLYRSNYWRFVCRTSANNLWANI